MRNSLFKKADPDYQFYRPTKRVSPGTSKPIFQMGEHVEHMGLPHRKGTIAAIEEGDPGWVYAIRWDDDKSLTKGISEDALDRFVEREPVSYDNLPAFDEVHYIHYPDDSTFSVVLFNDGKGQWSKVVDDADLDKVVGKDAATNMRSGEGQDIKEPNVTGVELPFKSLTIHSKGMTEQDEAFLKDLRISGHLRQRVRAAYSNGCASHAMQWLGSHRGTRGSEGYAKKNGLQPAAFKEAIRSMSRFASARRKLAGTSCAKCGLPFGSDAMTSRTVDGTESHLTCPRAASQRKKAVQYVDDEWRQMLEAQGYEPQTIFQGKREFELWSSTYEADTEVQIDRDANDDPYYEVYVSDQLVMKGVDSQELRAFLQAGEGDLSVYEPPVNKELNARDKDFLKSLKIQGKKAADPKWVGWAPGRKKTKEWDMGGPLDRKQLSVLPYAGNNPHMPRNVRPKMEPPVADTPEFAIAMSNVGILHRKKAIGQAFTVVFPQRILEVAPGIVKEFRSQFKLRLQKLQWADQFKITLQDDGLLMVERVQAPWETGQPTPRGEGETYDYLDERIEELIKVPVEWLNRIAPAAAGATASLKTAGRYGFFVPMESAAHVAHHLAEAGLLDFEVETDEDIEESYFSFPDTATAEVAHEVVRANFKRQIEGGRGEWANWKQLEPASTMQRKKRPMLSSKQAGAWGDRSYDNDSVHDILDKYRKRGGGFDEPIPSENMAALLADMDTLIDNAHTPEDQACFFGVMVWLMSHGEELDGTHKALAIEIGRELAGNQQYLKMWRDPTVRKSQIQTELKYFGNPMSLHASDDSLCDEIADPVCLCGHTFHDHERGCDHCECSGFDPAPITKQVEYLCEHRSFGRVGGGTNPMVFERDKNERILKVYLDGDRVIKAEFLEKKGDTPESRKGWDGFFAFTQALGIKG